MLANGSVALLEKDCHAKTEIESKVQGSPG